MAPAERDYVRVAARLERDGEISSVDVAHALGVTTKQASMRRQRLIDVHQVLTAPQRGELRFSLPDFGDWFRSLDHRGGAPAP